jgi:hypothetical protein
VTPTWPRYLPPQSSCEVSHTSSTAGARNVTQAIPHRRRSAPARACERFALDERRVDVCVNLNRWDTEGRAALKRRHHRDAARASGRSARARRIRSSRRYTSSDGSSAPPLVIRYSGQRSLETPPNGPVVSPRSSQPRGGRSADKFRQRDRLARRPRWAAPSRPAPGF